jgi:undecaprenyl-diphosphatase
MSARDRAWLRAVAGRSTPNWVDRILRAATHLGGVLVTVVISFGLVLFEPTRPLGLATAVANFFSHLVVQALKRSVVRPRPAEWGVAPLGTIPDAFSFPSGHSCAAMALAVPVCFVSWPAGIGAVGLALLVGISRVYLRVHYVTDVVVGQLLGAATGVLVSLALR